MHKLPKIARITAFSLVMAALVLAACSSPTEVPVAEAPDESAVEEQAPAGEAEEQPTEEEAAAEEETPEAVAPEVNLTDGCVTDYAEGIDYFPEKVNVEYAEGFTVEYHDNYKVVSVPAAWPGAESGFEYVLVQCGTPAPDGYPEASIIEVPVKTIVPMSTTHVTYLNDLGLLDKVVGLDTFLYVSNPTVREMIDAGELVEIAPNSEVNVETALDLNADLIMSFSSGAPEFDTHPVLIEAGLPVAMNADWLEGTPLARAEWIKYMALFFNYEARSEEVFTDVVDQYDAALALAASAESKPTVFNSVPFQGTWYIPGGASFIAELLKDAGADYLWADDESTGSLYLDFETVYDRAQDADFWINVNGFATLEDMAAADARYTDFRAFQEGSVYGNDARQTGFGNEYYETSAARPHILLLDLVKIFHPELLPDHEFYYYRQLQ